MLCTNCKQSVKDGAKFCPYCGNRIIEENHSTTSEIMTDKKIDKTLRQIVIAAVGEPSDVHTLLVDEKYPYHLKGGELLRIPVSREVHKLKWSSPSLSVGSDILEIEPKGGNIFFKILREKEILGISKYTIKKASSVQELACFCQQERMAEAWADNGLHACVIGDENFCMSYDDRLVVADKNDARKEVKYADLVSVARGSYLEICCYFNSPQTSKKMFSVVSFSGFRMPDETLEYINTRINELNGNAIHFIRRDKNQGLIVWKDKIVFIDVDGIGREFYYESLMLVQVEENLFRLYSWNNYGYDEMQNLVYLDEEDRKNLTEYINGRITEINENAIYFIRRDKNQGLIVWKDKIVFIDMDGIGREFCYESLMLVQVEENLFRLYSWNNFGYDEIQNLVHLEKKERRKLTEYINGRITEKHGFHTALAGKECMCVIYDDKMVMHGKDGAVKEIEYASIMDVGRAIVPQTMVVYHWNNPNDASEQYNFESLPDRVLQYINRCAYKINGSGLYVSVHDIENKNSLLFYEDRFAVIDKDNMRKESSYKELVEIRLDGSIHYWDTSNAILDIAPCMRGFNWTTEMTMEVNKRIQKTRGNDAVEVFAVTFSSDVKRISFEFCKNKDRFHIRRGNRVGPDYPISGILDYELKTSERAGNDGTSSALSGALLGGVLGGGIVGILAGASMGHRLGSSDAKLEHISLWMTIETVDGRIVTEKSTLFNRKTSTGLIEKRITELTMYLDGIMSLN